MQVTPHFRIALAIIWRDGEVLIARRRAEAQHLPNLWEFPGGKCEDSETPRACAVREAREELGVEIEVTGQRAAIQHQYPARRVTLYPVDCLLIRGEPRPLASTELRWLRPQELDDREFPAANASLLAELRRRANDPARE